MPTSTPTPTPTATPTNTPTPTSTPVPGTWAKLKYASYYSKNDLLQVIPPAVTAYDDDDNTNPYFEIGAPGAGLVAARTINLTSANANAKPNSTSMSLTGFSTTYTMTPTAYLEYVKGRKQYKMITDLADITEDGIYVWNGAGAMDITDANKVAFDNKKVVVVAPSAITVSTTTSKTLIPQGGGSLALIAPTISFNAAVSEVDAIVIGSTVTTGTNNALGLKINGNLIALGALTNTRKNSPVSRLLFCLNKIAFESASSLKSQNNLGKKNDDN